MCPLFALQPAWASQWCARPSREGYKNKGDTPLFPVSAWKTSCSARQSATIRRCSTAHLKGRCRGIACLYRSTDRTTSRDSGRDSGGGSPIMKSASSANVAATAVASSLFAAASFAVIRARIAASSALLSGSATAFGAYSTVLQDSAVTDSVPSSMKENIGRSSIMEISSSLSA